MRNGPDLSGLFRSSEVSEGLENGFRKTIKDSCMRMRLSGHRTVRPGCDQRWLFDREGESRIQLHILNVIASDG